MKNALTSLAKSVLIPLGLTAAAEARDEAIQKEIGSGMTTLIISNKEMGILIESISETIRNE